MSGNNKNNANSVLQQAVCLYVCKIALLVTIITVNQPIKKGVQLGVWEKVLENERLEKPKP